MKIIYGVAGEGLGHSSRAVEMIHHLRKQGHQVLPICYGLAIPILKEDGKILEVEGVHLKYKNSVLSISKTVLQNTAFVLENLKNSEKIFSTIKKFKPDVAITDYEPITALLSYKFKLPLISIDNQHSLTYAKMSVPRKYYKNYLLAKTATRFNPPKADYYIILAFSKLEVKKKNATLVAPILRSSIIKKKPTVGKNVIVYLNRPDDNLMEILKTFPEKFIVYGYEKESREENLVYKMKGAGFVEDLAVCKAIIATAGFSLMSEALFWDKPYFALPLKGQFEQLINALFLKKSGFGEFSNAPDRKEIQKFLSRRSLYESNLKKYIIDPNEAFEVMDSILQKIRKNKKEA